MQHALRVARCHDVRTRRSECKRRSKSQVEYHSKTRLWFPSMSLIINPDCKEHTSFNLDAPSDTRFFPSKINRFTVVVCNRKHALLIVLSWKLYRDSSVSDRQQRSTLSTTIDIRAHPLQFDLSLWLCPVIIRTSILSWAITSLSESHTFDYRWWQFSTR